MFVGAVDGTEAWSRRTIFRRSLQYDARVSPGPGPAADHLVVARPARAPFPGPAGIFGEENGVRGAIRDLHHAGHVVGLENAAVGRRLWNPALKHQNLIDIKCGRIIPASALAAPVEHVEGHDPVLLRR